MYEFIHTLDNGFVVQHGRTYKTHSGRYCIETKNIKEPYVLNMNIPFFDTEEQAKNYMLSLPNWKMIAAS